MILIHILLKLGMCHSVINFTGWLNYSTVLNLDNTKMGNWEHYKDLPKVFKKFLRELDVCSD